MEGTEKLLFWGEKRTIDDVLEDNRQLELKLFKIALKRYVDELDNESQLDYFKQALNPSNWKYFLIVGTALFSVIYYIKYFLN